jgi:hypothetical protein
MTGGGSGQAALTLLVGASLAHFFLVLGDLGVSLGFLGPLLFVLRRLAIGVRLDLGIVALGVTRCVARTGVL